jgi:hypothetical protein
MDTIDDLASLKTTTPRLIFAAPWGCGHTAVGPKPKPGPPPDSSLGGSDYVGQHDPRLGNAVNGAQSTYEGAIVTTLLDRDLVSAILPAGLELAAPSAGPIATHPVLYLLGRQNDPLGLQNGTPQRIPTARPYTELILLIPFTVRSGGSSRWHSYAARMYLDNDGAIVIGNGIYAYSKERGDFDVFGDTTEVRWQDNTVFSAEVTDDGNWMAASAAAAPGGLPGFAEAMAIFDMPIVGHNVLLGFVCSYFEWDVTNAQVAAATSSHCFLQEFRAGMQGWVDLGFLENAENGAFKVRNVQWRLSCELPLQPANQPPMCMF